MKIGTDGVLLGAWADCKEAKNILDIGCGTGLLSLMLAQRNNAALITAIEIEEDAYHQAKRNCQKSKWNDRITIIKTSLQEYRSVLKYNLIICNPPFFSTSTASNNKARKLARDTSSLNFSELLKKSKLLLTKDGKLNVIIPFHRKEEFSEIAYQNNLNASKICNIKGRADLAYKRVLMEFKESKEKVNEEELVIEINRNEYTKKYISLCKGFYFKM